MPFQVRGSCYPDINSAIYAYRALYPVGPDSAGVIWSFASVPSSVAWSDGQQLTVNLVRSTDGATVPYAVYLRSCEPNSAAAIFDKYPLQDVIFAVAFLFVAVIGFAMGRRA